MTGNSITVPLLRDSQSQAPNAICELRTNNGTSNLLINRDKPPFDNADLRKAFALSIDHKAFVDTCEARGKIGGAMLPPPEGCHGACRPNCCKQSPVTAPMLKNRADAREMINLGYGPDKRLELTISTRNVPSFRDPAVILIDQLKEIYVAGVLDTIETANWHSKVTRKETISSRDERHGQRCR
jgi:peptide/nickel transport system substrate-binding protein